MNNKIAATAILTAAATLTAIAPAAATSTDASDRAYLWTITKGAWIDLDYDSQQSICDLYDLSHSVGISQMADIISEATDYEFSYSDARYTAKRLLRWGC